MRVAIAAAGTAAEIREAAAQCQARGIGRLTVAETGADPFVQLAYAAPVAPDVELATGVAIAFARTPMTLAYAAWSLQDVSGGRSVIGLGSQIQAHIERRFAMPWSAPAARMRDFILATRAIWAAWQDGARLNYRGDFYAHTLMNPLFVPPALAAGPPPIQLAAVGPKMCEVAGSVADGLATHPFGSASYLRAEVLPIIERARAAAVEAGARHTARPFSVDAGVLIATGRDHAEIAEATAAVRGRIAFYGSTPAYLGVLAHHGRADVGPQLHALSVRGQWREMAALVDDELLHALAVVGDPATCAAAIHERYAGVADVVTLNGSLAAPHAALLDAAAALTRLAG